MTFIPRQVKPPALVAISGKVPDAIATLLKHHAAFLESSQEYMITVGSTPSGHIPGRSKRDLSESRSSDAVIG